jgi:hypothetical protein
MIAHRLSTLESSDVLFEVAAGGITGLGGRERRDFAVPASSRATAEDVP